MVTSELHSNPSGRKLRKFQRLIEAPDFARVFRARQRGRVNGFVYYWLGHNGHLSNSGARLGISVSRKVSPQAVRRNRIKRIIRESFRHNFVHLKGLDIVLVAQPESNDMTNQELFFALQSIWRELRR